MSADETTCADDEPRPGDETEEPQVVYTVCVAHERTGPVEVGAYTVPCFGGERIAGHVAIRSGDIPAEMVPDDVWDRDADRIDLGDGWGDDGELRCDLDDGHVLIVEGPAAVAAREELAALHRRHWEEAGEGPAR